MQLLCPARPRAHPASPWFSASSFPTNGLFTSSLEWRDTSGAPLALERDDALSAALGFEVRRPADDLAPGATFFPTDDCPAAGECRHALVFGDADLTPPSAAELSDVRVIFADDAPETGSSCQVDALELEVVGTDDATPRDELVTVVLLGDTVAEASSVEAFALGFTYDVGPPDRRLVSTIVLGGADGHQRDGGPLRASGRSCFAVRVKREALLGERRSREVAAEPLDARAVTAIERDQRVHIGAGRSAILARRCDPRTSRSSTARSRRPRGARRSR